MLDTADDTIRAWAVKASAWEPVGTMLLHIAILIGTSRSRELGAVDFSVATDALSDAVAKPFLFIYKGVAMFIPAAILSFWTQDFKVRPTLAGDERIWFPSLPNFIYVPIFIFTTWSKILFYQKILS